MKTRVLLLFVPFLLALALTACSSNAGGSQLECTNPVSTTTVKMQDFAFNPSCVAVDEGATLTLNNTGQVIHSFTIRGTDVDVSVPAGETSQVSLNGVAPGSYTVICQYHPQMVGAIRIGNAS